ncbi:MULTISPECIES: isopentenyl phosphate kinase [Acidiplasma]|uniref:Isopentenyl phosphate kinase n=1 Tax=Acidiplasma cupricumulans TaxID=312540 RepID=A0A0N8VL94_9ARCH|nr:MULTISPECIES: isopentenyl phosphate kinase [Acidiplasma]KJE48970.1 kinase [Acidiplasma sp. MBA-1]KQB35892.1 kinase [Acidiplasma cupricumulans]WMT54392.1 MAG: isopentenyl phosphate kinase [Acidiplasma sp.]
MIILKLGGSIITDKKTYRKFEEDRTRKIIAEISKIKDKFIIIHGGGSFGHIMAKEYNIPGRLNKRSLYYMSLIHYDMSDLNMRVSKILSEYGMGNIPVPPSTYIYGKKKNYDIFRYYVKNNIMPVSYGDVYIKNRNYIGIYSGDDIIYDLSRIFMPEKVIFFSDVDGIFDKNPKIHKDAKLLKTVNKDFNFENDSIDVTGGIINKYNSMVKISKLGIKVYLINGLYPERIKDIGKDNFYGTVV